MKLKDGFLTHNTGEEQILVDSNANGFSGIVKSNKTGAMILELLQQETTEEGILSVMKETYGVDEVTLKRDLNRVLDILREIGALDE